MILCILEPKEKHILDRVNSFPSGSWMNVAAFLPPNGLRQTRAKCLCLTDFANSGTEFQWYPFCHGRTVDSEFTKQFDSLIDTIENQQNSNASPPALRQRFFASQGRYRRAFFKCHICLFELCVDAEYAITVQGRDRTLSEGDGCSR
jgi:hypothetical protein